MLNINYTYCVFDYQKKKKAIIIAVIAVCAILLFFGLKKNGNNSKIIAFSPEQTEIALDDDELLSYQKAPSIWNQRLKSDGSLTDFDLFTSPSAYRQNGTIVTKTYDMLIIDDALPLYLSAIQPKPYRLKIEGYSRSKNDEEVVIMFRDIETEKYGECTVNSKCDALNFNVKQFSLRGYEKDGVYYEVPVVLVYDEKMKKEFELTNEQKFLEGKYIVIIKDVNGNEYTLRDIGSTVQIGEALCTLRSFNQKEGIAKLLLKDAHGQEFHKTVHLIR